MSWRSYLRTLNESERVETDWVDKDEREIYIDDILTIARRHRDDVIVRVVDEDPNIGLKVVELKGGEETELYMLSKKDYLSGKFDLTVES